MFTKTTQGLAFDSICTVEGSFKILAPNTDLGSLELTTVYANRSNNEYYGTAKWPLLTFSAETLAAFQEFLRLAETDIGRIVFVERSEGSGPPKQPHPWDVAETNESLKQRPKGLGGV